jgi:hypothetical protein
MLLSIMGRFYWFARFSEKSTPAAKRACGSRQRPTRKSSLCQQLKKLLSFRAFSQSSTSSNIERRKLLQGGYHADAFVIAKAFVTQGTVVTMEGIRPNAVKIPNTCEYFSIPCMSLEDFMEREDWEF